MSSVKNILKTCSRNVELDEFLAEELKGTGYGGCDVQTTPLGTRLTIYVTRPGLVIKRKGVGIRELQSKIESRFGRVLKPPLQISVMEVEIPELNPRIMCDRIAHNMRRGVAFRRVVMWALNAIMDAGAMGAEIIVSGKLRRDRARTEKYRMGVMPKSGDPAEKAVREATTSVLLKMGVYGIKVRIALKDAVPPEFQLKEGESVAEGQG
ncbi:MAG: 30S ribosomal protein S3 [Thaumarchaeota archaeon]|nr:30S ribosomal protein S3 [Nitrososphaerota archaeon]